MQVLLINPEVDELTCYLLAWTEKILKECKNKSNKYFHLKRHRVSRKKFESFLNKHSIDLVLICGHGEDDRILGNSDEDIILDTLNDELLTGKVVHALSCQSAKKLGFDAIKKGAKAYIGYKEDFIAFYDNSKSVSKPFEDEIVSLFLKPAMVAPKSLLKGNSPEDAIVDARRAYNKSIKEALNSDIQSDADQFVNWLVWDRDNLISCK